MDSDFSFSYKQLPNKVYPYYLKKPIVFSDSLKNSSKPPNRKLQYSSKPFVVYSKQPHKSQIKESTMNQLAPRFQQRALYSQHYRTDYDTSWRANLLAATCRSKLFTRVEEDNLNNKFCNLGIRLEPEGAPSTKFDEREQSSSITDFDKVLNEESVLYSDYGSDSEELPGVDDSKSCKDSEENVPNSSWSTASLITHAFNMANCNKVTVMSYAVIGAELHSIAKLSTSKTEMDLIKISLRAQKLSENIDKARKNLKEIALGLRDCKQDLKAKNKKISNTTEKSHKHSAPITMPKSDLSFNSQDETRRFHKRKSVALLEKVSNDQFESYNLPNYCTIDRRHKYYKDPRNKKHDPNFMNLDSAENLQQTELFPVQEMKLKSISKIGPDHSSSRQ